MIQSEQQYQVTQNKLKELEEALARLQEIKDTLHPRQFLARKNGLESSINDLRRESKEYNFLNQNIRTLSDV